MKTIVLGVVLGSCLLAGCSFSMKGPDPQRPANSEPQCDRRIGLIVADRIIAGALAVGAVTALAQNADADLELQRQVGYVVAAGFAATSLVFLISQGVGSSRRSDCIAANEQWASAHRPLDPDRERASAPRAVAAKMQPLTATGAVARSGAAAGGTAAGGAAAGGAAAGGAAAGGAAAGGAAAGGAAAGGAAPGRAPAGTVAPQPASSPTSSAVAAGTAPAVGGAAGGTSAAAPAAAVDPGAPAARSFFCTSSLSRDALNVCLGDQPACERARQVLGVGDTAACAATSIAWCYDAGGKRRCFGASAVCSAQRAKAAAPTSECIEQHR